MLFSKEAEELMVRMPTIFALTYYNANLDLSLFTSI